MSKSENTGLARLNNALRYSIQGIKTAWKSEAAFRQELCCCFVLIPLAIWVGETGLERALLVFVLLLVLVVELINSAVEAVVDRFGGEYHTLSCNANDTASAAVFVAIIAAIITWGVVLLT